TPPTNGRWLPASRRWPELRQIGTAESQHGNLKVRQQGLSPDAEAVSVQYKALPDLRIAAWDSAPGRTLPIDSRRLFQLPIAVVYRYPGISLLGLANMADTRKGQMRRGDQFAVFGEG